MIEDKLNQEQRIRLECLAQAVASNVVLVRGETTDKILYRAKEFEKFVKDEEDE